MEELALNILDIACNSVRAKASLIRIDVAADTKKDVLQISVSDDGKGMSEEFLKTVTDPFATTRTTRKVGMGIPLFKMAAESADGAFAITSKVGVGTTTKASFALSHIDRMPRRRGRHHGRSYRASGKSRYSAYLFRGRKGVCFRYARCKANS